MLNVRHIPAALLAALTVAGLPAAHAQAVSPAPMAYSQIDPNTFVLGHPASPRWKVVHAGGEHPAVLVSRRAEQPASIDPNGFAVQPPATTRWVAASPAAPAVLPTLVAGTR